MLDLLYRNLDVNKLSRTFAGHGFLTPCSTIDVTESAEFHDKTSNRFVWQSTDRKVSRLAAWPPSNSSTTKELGTCQAFIDLLVLESAIEAGISDPFVWLDSDVWVFAPNAAGWLNVDMAIKDPVDQVTVQATKCATQLLAKYGCRSYGYGHRLPVAISHSNVQQLMSFIRRRVGLNSFITEPSIYDLDLKTLLLNLDPARQSARPVYIDNLPIYRHLDGSVGSVIALRTLPPTIFLTADRFSEALLAYVQNL